MSVTKTTVEYITPTRAELQPFHKIHCRENQCEATFTNAGNYELHLQRHHKITTQRKNESQLTRLYYCPDAECVYNIKKGADGRHFKQLKNLRQHFQKIHYKNFICERCGRTFPTQGQLKTHASSICGKKFKCDTCNWEFETKDALVLHGKRKGHVTQEANEAVPLTKNTLCKRARLKKGTDSKEIKAISKDKKTEKFRTQHKDTQTKTILPRLDSFTNTNALYEYHDSETQTEKCLTSCLMPQTSILDSLDAIYHDTETQTDNSAFIAMGCGSTRSVLEDFQALHHHDIETQTEPSLQQRSQRHTSPMINSNSGGGFLDQMLSHTPLTHMHTQTCDDFLLSELGLSDIQTQTNWTSFSEGTNATTTKSTSTTGFAHDELLVSTETQTSFTQCLLDSTAGRGHITTDNAATCTAGGGIGEESNPSNYAHLYNTQQTQTCDLLLEGLFGGQENDLIAGFQSTYTQT